MSDYLPQKVIVEILARLPVKSILRFRGVSKSWSSLISSSYFLNTHLSTTSTDNTGLLLLRHYSQRKERFSLYSDNETFDRREELNCPFLPKLKFYFRIVGFCNGLLCLTDDLFGYTNTVILWNPSIRRFLALPVPGFTYDVHKPFMCVHGFGVDVKKNDYKVVRISYLGGENGFMVPPKVEIYAVSERSWRYFEGFVPEVGIREYFWDQAYVNGKVHWVAHKRIDPEYCRCFVLLFDLGDEVFREFELPESLARKLPKNIMNMVTAVVGGSLAVLQYDSRLYSKTCAIWVMKQYGLVESWCKQYEVELDGRLAVMLGLRKNGEMLLGMGKELVSFDYESQEEEKLGVRGSKDVFWACNYKESLVLLEEGTQVMKGLANTSDAVTSAREAVSSVEEDGAEEAEEEDGAEEDHVSFRTYGVQTLMLYSLTINC